MRQKAYKRGDGAAHLRFCQLKDVLSLGQPSSGISSL
jgi:hypothetical protein